MKLSKRISKILEFIDVNDKVADIGCDHGYLGLGCIEKGVSFLQNIDNKKGPLDTAKRNLKDYEHENVIYTLCDGLDGLHENIDTVVISGMGGDLISQIIKKNLSKALKLKKIILVAHTKVQFLRSEIMDNFKIIDETLVEDNKKIYEIMILNPSPDNNYSYEDIMFGPILRTKKEDLFIKKLNKRLDELNNILAITSENEALIKERIKIMEILK
ncbi:MAG: SAM-dependent methyltransferase [Bacilli bacterium]|nr:SAM-dependent methyltransferase [Bacilli bacterium]